MRNTIATIAACINLASLGAVFLQINGALWVLIISMIVFAISERELALPIRKDE